MRSISGDCRLFDKGNISAANDSITISAHTNWQLQMLDKWELAFDADSRSLEAPITSSTLTAGSNRDRKVITAVCDSTQRVAHSFFSFVTFDSGKMEDISC